MSGGFKGIVLVGGCLALFLGFVGLSQYRVLRTCMCCCSPIFVYPAHFNQDMAFLEAAEQRTI